MSPMRKLWLVAVVALLIIASSTAHASVAIDDLTTEILMVAGDSSPPTVSADLTTMSHNDMQISASLPDKLNSINATFLAQEAAMSPLDSPAVSAAAFEDHLSVCSASARKNLHTSGSYGLCPNYWASNAISLIQGAAQLTAPMANGKAVVPRSVEMGRSRKHEASLPAGFYTHGSKMKRSSLPHSVIVRPALVPLRI